MTETQALSLAVEALASSKTAPKLVRTSASALAQRLKHPVSVVLVCPDETRLSALGKDIQAKATAATIELEVCPIANPSDVKLLEASDTTPVLGIVVDADSSDELPTNILTDLEINSDQIAVWAPQRQSGKFSLEPEVAFISNENAPNATARWVVSQAVAGLEADRTTALYFCKKYKVDCAKYQQIAPAPTSGTSNSQEIEIAPPDADDIRGCLAWSLDTYDTLARHWNKADGSLETEDFLAAYDQLVLLEIEGTESAAVNALCIILQLLREIEGRCQKLTVSRLPNFKLAKAS